MLMVNDAAGSRGNGAGVRDRYGDTGIVELSPIAQTQSQDVKE